MAAPAMETYRSSFSPFGHLLNVCAPSVQQRYHCVEEDEDEMSYSQAALACEPKAPLVRLSAAARASALPSSKVAERKAEIAAVHNRMTLSDLADGPYFTIARQLGPETLACVDAACRLTRDLNQTYGGPWCMLGKRAFYGLELDGDSLFDELDCKLPVGEGGSTSLRPLQTDWKARYGRFRQESKMFRSPFTGSEIAAVEQADEIAYCQCKLRTDLLFDSSATAGVYIEVEVSTNPDNVSLAVVDFEGGGCSSVTFSPDTGAVIRERKVREAPRKVEGTYIQPLTTITSGQGFEGMMGLYLQGGQLSFFRKHAQSSEGDGKGSEAGAWESTGFVTDLTWAEGRRLTPCLAFRDVGTYQVRLTCVDTAPPVLTEKTASAYDESNWRSLDWDAGEQEPWDM